MGACGLASSASVISGTTYPSDDPEMLAVEADYADREARLQEKIDNIESSHPMTAWTIMIMARKIPRNGKPKMRKSLRMVLRVLTLMRNAIEQIELFERSVFQIIAG